MNKDLLILEVMALGYAVDRSDLNDYAVFIDYSGHVEQLSIKIVESKERYLDEVATTEFYIDGKFDRDDKLAWLKAKRDHLKQIIEEGEIDTSEMNEVIETTVSYAF